MGEEESKASENNDEANTSTSSEKAKLGIKDRMREMGILDREKQSADSAPARPWKLYITGAVIVAGIGLWYWTSGAFLNEAGIQPMAHNMPPPGARGPYGWPAPPPHFQARPDNQAAYRRPPPRWNGPPPAYYYGRGYNPPSSQQNSAQNSNLNDQGAARPWPPRRGQYGPGFAQRPPYYGPQQKDDTKSTSPEVSGNNAGPISGWRRPPTPPQRPQWAGPQRPNYQHPPQSSQPRFGPPPQRHWNNTPPGWPREAWRATRPEEAQKQQQQQQQKETPATSAQPDRQWPEPPRRRWGPGYNNQYNPYGSFQPSSYQGANNKDNPWSQ